MTTLGDLELRLGFEFTDYQRESLYRQGDQQGPRQRACLYFRTGAGKTLTGLALMALWGQERVLVIAPPSTYHGWENAGLQMGIEVTCTSHAMFRKPGYKLDRNVPVIVDEFHLLGGHRGKGWIKMDRLAAGIKAPLIIMSATPNYNDAERVYCIQHVLDPASVKGGFLEFLYKNCEVKHNPFSATPEVEGFLHYKDAAEYLSSMDLVEYVPDELEWTIVDIPYSRTMPPSYLEYGLDRRKAKIIASQIEERHTRTDYGLTVGYKLRTRIYHQLYDLVGNSTTPVLIFAEHATIAEAVFNRLEEYQVNSALITGKTPAKQKREILAKFNAGDIEVLVGTASLATGTDGMDKVCNTLIILDDTSDDSLRRQLVGRIMPRGLDTDATGKNVYRLIPKDTD